MSALKTEDQFIHQLMEETYLPSEGGDLEPSRENPKSLVDYFVFKKREMDAKLHKRRSAI